MGRRAHRRRRLSRVPGSRNRRLVHRRHCRLVNGHEPLVPYVELHAASAFSFLQAATLPEVLVDRAVDLGYSALALLDRDGVYGLPSFHKAATAAGIKPIVGAELTIQTENVELRAQSSDTLSVLCESREGYRNLCRLITRMKLRSPKGEGALTLDEMDGCTRGLVALVGRAAL